MKKLIVFLMFLLLLLGDVITLNAQVTVFVNPPSRKFHIYGCPNLDYVGAKALVIDVAKTDGYTHCNYCYYVWVNPNSTVCHFKDCKYLDKEHAKSVTIEEAYNRGYAYCDYCMKLKGNKEPKNPKQKPADTTVKADTKPGK